MSHSRCHRGKPWERGQIPTMSRLEPWGAHGTSCPPSFQRGTGCAGWTLQEFTCASVCLQPPLPPSSTSAPGRRIGHLGSSRCWLSWVVSTGAPQLSACLLQVLPPYAHSSSLPSHARSALFNTITMGMPTSPGSCQGG